MQKMNTTCCTPEGRTSGHNMRSCTMLYKVVQGYIVNTVYRVHNIVQLAAL